MSFSNHLEIPSDRLWRENEKKGRRDKKFFIFDGNDEDFWNVLLSASLWHLFSSHSFCNAIDLFAEECQHLWRCKDTCLKFHRASKHSALSWRGLNYSHKWYVRLQICKLFVSNIRMNVTVRINGKKVKKQIFHSL